MKGKRLTVGIIVAAVVVAVFVLAVESINSRRAPGNMVQGGDPGRPVGGVPKQPEHPIRAEIVAVGDTYVYGRIDGVVFYKTNVTLNAGRSERVVLGMSFFVYEPRNIRTAAGSVLSVGEHTSEAFITQMGTETTKPTPPKVRWRVVTSTMRFKTQGSNQGKTDRTS